MLTERQIKYAIQAGLLVEVAAFPLDAQEVRRIFGFGDEDDSDDARTVALIYTAARKLMADEDREE